jgi:hypothetical protein
LSGKSVPLPCGEGSGEGCDIDSNKAQGNAGSVLPPEIEGFYDFETIKTGVDQIKEKSRLPPAQMVSINTSLNIIIFFLLLYPLKQW